MNEHELLKKVADKIWFSHSSYDRERMIFKEWIWENERRLLNVREIIFTSEFMNKFIEYRINWNIKAIPCKSLKDTFYSTLIEEHLDNPVQYLYSLIK